MVSLLSLATDPIDADDWLRAIGQEAEVALPRRGASAPRLPADDQIVFLRRDGEQALKLHLGRTPPVRDEDC